MKQSEHLNPSEETGTGCPVTSKYGRAEGHLQTSMGVWVDNNATTCNFWTKETWDVSTIQNIFSVNKVRND